MKNLTGLFFSGLNLICLAILAFGAGPACDEGKPYSQDNISEFCHDAFQAEIHEIITDPKREKSCLEITAGGDYEADSMAFCGYNIDNPTNRLDCLRIIKNSKILPEYLDYCKSLPDDNVRITLGCLYAVRDAGATQYQASALDYCKNINLFPFIGEKEQLSCFDIIKDKIYEETELQRCKDIYEFSRDLIECLRNI